MNVALGLGLGAGPVKPFPASVRPTYISALRGPFPDLAIVPTGGVDAENAPEYLGRGAIAIGLGSSLTR